MTTIAVTTPNGHVGRYVVRSLVRAGVRPRVLMRDPGKVDDELVPLVDARTVDQNDEAAVVEATQGVDALFWVDPPTEDDDPLDGYARLSAVVASAVRSNAIPRVVFQSSGGAEIRHGAGEIDGLAATEVALDEVAAGVVHLRCGYFFTNLLLDPGALERGVLTTAMPVDAPMPWVDPRDIADVATGWLLRAHWSGRHVQAVHGPRDLSFADVARTLSTVLGREIRAEHIEDDDLHAVLTGVGMTDQQADATVKMSSGLRDGYVPEQPRDAVSTTPSELGAWAWANLR